MDCIRHVGDVRPLEATEQGRGVGHGGVLSGGKRLESAGVVPTAFENPREARDCGSGGPPFEPGKLYHQNLKYFSGLHFLGSFAVGTGWIGQLDRI
jgi:hypothetical protein